MLSIRASRTGVSSRVLALVISSAVSARAQPDFGRTQVVDVSATGSADFNSIQSAIDDIPTPVNVRWTVLVYAGTYTEVITLAPSQTNIDIVGVDRDAVIIQPPTDASAAITISGNGPRRNAIRNLTIITDKPQTPGPDGIVIRQFDPNEPIPSEVQIEGVTIECRQGSSNAVRIEDNAGGIRLRDVAVTLSGASSRGVYVEGGITDLSIDGLSVKAATAAAEGIRVAAASERLAISRLAVDLAGDDSLGLNVASDPNDPDGVKDVRIDGLAASVSGEDSCIILVAGGTEGLAVSNAALSLTGARSHALRVTAQSSEIAVRAATVALTAVDTKAVLVESAMTNLTVENVTVRGPSGGHNAVRAPDCDGLVISNCDFLVHDGHVVQAGSNTRILSSSIVCEKSYGGHPQSQDDTFGIEFPNADTTKVLVSGSRVQGRNGGVKITDDSDITFIGCDVSGGNFGVLIQCGDDVVFQDCTIRSDARVGAHGALPLEQFNGVQLADGSGCSLGRIAFVGCSILAHAEIPGQGVTAQDAYGVRALAAPAGSSGPVRFVDCAIRGEATDDALLAYGVHASEAGAVALFGGAVTSFDENEREPNQYDLFNAASGGALGILISGTNASKWSGPIGAAAGAAPVTQRTINVAAPSTATILTNTPLSSTEQVITSGFNQPGAYRALSVRGNVAGVSGNVIIIGTDFAGQQITDVLALNGASTVDGVKPFMAVTKIILPARTAELQSVSVGTTAKLGLFSSIPTSGAVQQQARKASAATSYTLESVGTIDTVHATVAPASITAGDSFEWSVLGNR